METLFVNSQIASAILFLYVTLVFGIARLARDNSVMDIAYGPAFFICIGTTMTLTVTFDLLPTIIAVCMVLWGTRLSLRIYRQHRGKPEDARYARWRHRWLQRGYLYFLIRSYLQINILQGIIIFLIAFPGLLAISFPQEHLTAFAIIGLIVFAIGFGYETLADWQLDRFLARKKRGKESAPLMTSGLFAYSRRPNYFGETLVWWGIAIMVLPLPYGWLGLISPLLITYIVTKVTGPMLEQHFLETYPEEYRAYMESTNYLIPGPKKVMGSKL